MGIDQGTVGMLQQGVDLAGNVMGLVRGSDDGSSAMASRANERGLQVEADAKSHAQEVQKRAKKNANNLRATGERIRGKSNANWGGSNLAMSGSKKLVKEGSRIKDSQMEEDALLEGQMDADDILNEGRHKANMFRISGGASPMRSTLSLGSKIYTRR